MRIDEQTNEPPVDTSLEEDEEKTVEFDRTMDEIEGENLTKNQAEECNVGEQHPTARFVRSFLLSYRVSSFI